LRAIAHLQRRAGDRVRRLPPPIRAGNPERFYEEQSEIAHDMNDLALRVAGPARKGTPMPESQGRRREERTVEVINGHGVTVQRRRPAFCIFVEKA
jgi:hypothetical protein